MKRILVFVSVVVMAVLVQSVVLALSNPMIGTWKMNAEKSKFNPGPAPKSHTITIEAAGDGMKSTEEGTAPDGTSISWSYTANYEGKDNPITGTGVPSGADTIALTRINANTTKAVFKKGGKVVRMARLAVSKDGKVMKIAARGKDADGTKSSALLVLDKQ